MTEASDMESVFEAILFVANDPVPRDKLLEVFDEKEREAAKSALERVVERFSDAGRGGVVIDEAAGGLRLVSRPDLHGYLRRFFEATGSNKLSMPALETLAIIAYRQPVTAPEISELRGVASQGVIKTLLERRLVRVAGRKEVVGKPFLYATTRDFLMHFGLRNLSELPPLEQFEELFGGDPEADGDPSAADPEEEAQREANAVEEAEEEETRRREEEEEERQKAESEALELDPDAPEPAADAPEPAADAKSEDPGDGDATAEPESATIIDGEHPEADGETADGEGETGTEDGTPS